MRSLLADICGSSLESEDAALMISQARPAARLTPTSAATGCHLGGAALLEPATAWPANAREKPLSLLCVLNLSELASLETDLELPASGILNVFYDHVEQPAGFEPTHRDGWRLVWADEAAAVEAPAPSEATTFVSVGLEATQTLTIPGWEEPAVASLFPPHTDRSDAAFSARGRCYDVEEAWAEAFEAPTSSNHQVGGWPSLQQAPIWTESDLVSSGHTLGTYLDWEAAESFRSREREALWGLLLQIDSDDEAGWMWGDGGMLYFTMQRPFDPTTLPDAAWMILQGG